MLMQPMLVVHLSARSLDHSLVRYNLQNIVNIFLKYFFSPKKSV